MSDILVLIDIPNLAKRPESYLVGRLPCNPHSCKKPNITLINSRKYSKEHKGEHEWRGTVGQKNNDEKTEDWYDFFLKTIYTIE